MGGNRFSGIAPNALRIHRQSRSFKITGQSVQFLGPIDIYRELMLPERATPAGYAALIDAYELAVPLPRVLFAIGSRHRVVESERWHLLTPRHAPVANLEGHLVFALKNEGVDLMVLKALFAKTGPAAIEEIVNASPTGSYARRIWFFYEWLIGERLDLADATRGNYVEALDPERQYGLEGINSRRHRVRDNLPGTPQFCPLVFRTRRIDEFIDLQLEERAREVVARVPRDLLVRTAAFLLLKDSRSSYAIEGERPPQDRIQRWGRAIGQAGRRPVTAKELSRLQKMVIGDARFVTLGLRREDGFVGEHDRLTRMPIPVHISARPDDLESLIEGLVEFAEEKSDGLPPVIAAAIFAFGFVYIHPFADGNGRIHRYLIHHILSKRGFHPPQMVFPVSSAILDRIDEYEEVLESYSARLLPLIDWAPTREGNVDVKNDTADYYRFFDATPHVEFLFACVEKTIVEDLPKETEFLRRYDEFCRRVEMVVDMPNQILDLLFRFLEQNEGRLSKRGRQKEFAALTGEEVQRVEEIYEDVFSQ